MTSFTIEQSNPMQGYGKIDRAAVLADAAADAAPPNATPEEIGIEVAKLVIAQIWSGKKPETVRRHLCGLWSIIAPLAETAPDSFDAILTEFAERATDFR